MVSTPVIISQYMSLLIIATLLVTYIVPGFAEGVNKEHTCQNDGVDGTCENDEVLHPSSHNHLLIELIPELKSWVESLGGRFHESQEIRPISSDPASPLGFFAVNEIEKGDELLFVPWEATLKGSDYIQKEEDNFVHGEDAWCDMIAVLLQYFDDEEYPSYYFNYLDKKSNVPPELWSEKGKELLESMVGLNLPPASAKHFSSGETSIGYWAETCEGRKTEVTQQVTALADSSRYLDLMVPMLDLYSFHRNETTGTIFEIDQDEGVKLFAGRKINKNEQIFVTNDDQKEYTTPDVFANFGYVEQMPQRWIFGNKLDFTMYINDLDEYDIDLDGSLLPTYNDLSFLMNEEERLRSFRLETKELGKDNFPGVKLSEWDIIWQYNDALLTAIQTFLQKFDNDDLLDDSLENADVYLMSEDEELWRNKQYTCNLDDNYMSLSDDDIKITSQYQNLTFFEKPEVGDVCLDLDLTLQICQHYRPYYHEPFVQFSSTLLREMKRVLFVGGGDSMLLHEVMKYPEVELIVGLELDQKVVRQSFKRFHTQPHFDLHDKVQWWFGDATKSLKLLPRSYFGSFDLVMIDLSETVMSFTVTEKLDMLSALSLLIKPDGIFMKNEKKYYQKFQEMFDNAMELYLPNNPTLCAQHFAIGSHQLNLLAPNLHQVHNIETLMYKPLEDPFNHYKLIQDYSKNVAKSCFGDNSVDDSIDESEDDDSMDNANWTGGILMILEAEEVTLGEDELKDLMTQCLHEIKSTPISLLSHKMLNGEGMVTTMVFKEGYMIGRNWPKYSYVGFDINLWGAFNEMEFIKKSLLQAVRSKNSSAYRIVVGGISQSDDEIFDQEEIGPLIVNNRKCEEDVHEDIDVDILIISESSKLLPNENERNTILFCEDMNSCTSLDAFDEAEKDDLLILTSCNSNNGENTSNVFSLCGNTTASELKNILEKQKIIMKTIIFDANFSLENMKHIIDFLGRKVNRISHLQSEALLIVPGVDDWRNYLIEKLRLKISQSPVTIVGIDYPTNNSQGLLMGIGYKSIIADASNMVEKIKSQSGSKGILLKSIMGDPIRWQENYKPQYFNQSDYDSLPALEQFSSQLPLGSQTIFQYENPNASEINDLSQKILISFKNAVDDLEVLEYEKYTELGNGILIIAILKEGHAILQWDGASHIDFNVFTYDEEINHEMLNERLQKYLEGFDLFLKDEQPRGINRVINFKRDIGERTPGCWDVYAKCEFYKEKGYCNSLEREPWMDESWMLLNCRKSCEKCQLD